MSIFTRKAVFTDVIQNCCEIMRVSIGRILYLQYAKHHCTSELQSNVFKTLVYF